MKNIGFIGLGVMGGSMARHILEAGYTLHVYNRTSEKAKLLVEKGAIWEENVASLAEKCECVITIVGFPRDVEEVYLGAKGLLENAKTGTYLIDMTTSSPDLAVRIHAAAQKKGLKALDAPVSGGDRGAREGTLSIMVGGELEDFEVVRPLFEVMGKNIVYQGAAGSGQHTKMANQIAIASNMIGVCEAVSYAIKAGLDPDKVLESIAQGAAGSWSLSNLAPRMIAGDFNPGFYIKHFIKDMRIALESADRLGLDTPGLEMSLSMYKKLAHEGYEDDGTQALFRFYNEKKK
ncbi:MAG: NAD(P)-dependent oxidoreductase [Aminobacterium sp.]|uniref:NAD(P)-dependent oxidoreductase n=1 Tax=Aminobacterium sp. TaxID=1872491 RepID=UPI002B21E545|nr:NAD(P)-dependent oxidoreductase [Aminobacterium sp.]MEA4877635.1 NAD(P)-dependent oxidoreductase [Aminobacterium sp.]